MLTHVKYYVRTVENVPEGYWVTNAVDVWEGLQILKEKLPQHLHVIKYHVSHTWRRTEGWYTMHPIEAGWKRHLSEIPLGDMDFFVEAVVQTPILILVSSHAK